MIGSREHAKSDRARRVNSSTYLDGPQFFRTVHGVEEDPVTMDLLVYRCNGSRRHRGQILCHAHISRCIAKKANGTATY